MNDDDRMLAEAWRDLAGWRVGMVSIAPHPNSMGGVVVIARAQLWVYNEPEDRTFVWDLDTTGLLPDLDSPANWGHWLAWADRALDGILLYRDGELWVAEMYGGNAFSNGQMNPAAALLELAIREGVAGTEAPSVLAWWKAEQKANDGC